MFRGGWARCGEYAEPGPDAAPKRAKWRVDLRLPKGAVRAWRSGSPPLAIGDVVIVGGLDYAYSAHERTKGELRWTFETGISNSHGELVAPWLDGERVGLATAKGIVTVDPQTGLVESETALASPLVSPPAFAGDALIYATKEALICRSSGHELWSLATASEVRSAVSVEGDVAIVRTRDGMTIGVAISTGKELWRRRTGAVAARGVPIRDGVVYCATGDGEALLAVDLWDGSTRFAHRAHALVFGSPAIAGELVLFSTMHAEEDLHALARKTGEHRWSSRSGAYSTSEFSVCGDRIWVASGSTLSEIDHANGEQLWSFDAKRATVHPPELSRGDAFVVTTHHLVAL